MGYCSETVQLFLSDIGSQLYTVDITTGVRTLVGDMSDQLGGADNRGLAFVLVPTATPTPTPTPQPITVSLPIDTMDNSVPIATVIFKPVVTTDIDASLNYVAFQGDFTFDETICTFSSPFVEKAGLTSGNWNVSGNILPGPGPIRTLRVSAFSIDFTLCQVRERSTT